MFQYAKPYPIHHKHTPMFWLQWLFPAQKCVFHVMSWPLRHYAGCPGRQTSRIAISVKAG